MESRKRDLVAGELVFQQKVELRIFEQRYCFGSHDVQEFIAQSRLLQGGILAGHNFHTLRPFVRTFP